MTNDKTQCPLCGSKVDIKNLAKSGLTEDDLQVMSEYISQKSLIPMLELAEIASRQLDPKKMSIEVQVKDTLAKLTEKARTLMEKQREYFEKITKDEKMEKNEITEKAFKEQKEMIENYRQESKLIQEELRALEKDRIQEIEQFNRSIIDVKERIVGTGIGKIGETITAKDLKSAFCCDSFSNMKASRGGADIVATVREAGTECGKIVVSVKYVENWTNEFLTQLSRNMTEERTRWGMLVSKSFPIDALNDKAFLTETGVFIVKPEYASVAYMGLRQAAIHWAEAQSYIKNRESQMQLEEHIGNVLREWIESEKFQEVIGKIEDAMNASKETDDILQQWQRYSQTRCSRIRDLQNDLRGHLLDGSSLLSDLKKTLTQNASEVAVLEMIGVPK